MAPRTPTLLVFTLGAASERGRRRRMLVHLLRRVLAERRRTLPAPGSGGTVSLLPEALDGRAPPADLFH